jgi:hypothetical protein
MEGNVQGEFAAILGVKDERELLPHCMAHLARIGVDRVHAIDCGSTDGSLEWLQANAGDRLRVERYDDRDPDAASWERLNLRLARESGAGWVLFLDADEFWIPASGSLRGCAGLATSDVVRVPRFNVPLGPGGACLGPGEPPGDPASLLLIVEPVPDFRSRLDADATLPWIRGVPVPKIMARPGVMAGLHDGGHELRGADEAALRRREPDDLLIAHLPFTTAARFERKLANIRRVFEVHDAYFGEHLAWHWRRWLALPDAAAVRAEFQRQAFDADTLRGLRESGVVQDAATWFARHGGG